MIIATAVIALDQLTKWWAMEALSDGPTQLLGDTLRLRLTRNPGAAFSLFSDGGPILGLLALVVVVIIVFVLADLDHRLDVVALGFVLGGALGNFLDRVFRGDGILDGAVVDFIDLSFWPTFNVADSGITIGVALLLIGSLRRH